MNLDPLVSFALICLFLLWFYGPWQETCIDYARQIIFEERDKIFDLASAGSLRFDSRQYKHIRASLNAAIRYAHELTLARMIFTKFYKKTFPIDESIVMSKIDFSSLDAGIRGKLAASMNRSLMAMMLSMLARSLIVVALCIFLSPLFAIAIVCYFWWIGFSIEVIRLKRRITNMIGSLVQIEAGYDDGISPSC